jgi:glycosyltransferase involved in cell wall biosynthesis
MASVISLFTCTRNPATALFGRALEAVAALDVPAGAEIEYVIVDNASDPPLSARAAEFPALARLPNVRIVSEPTPGTSAARRRAVRETRGELLIWLDDDAVLARDYLTKALAVATAHPGVSAFGAGTIDVEFTDPVPDWVGREMRAFFQERRHAHTEFGTPRGWTSYCPFGTGLVTRRQAMQRWSDAVERGTYAIIGRDGRSMLAGEDAQVIFSAVNAGEQIGVTPELRLTHLIPGRRCTEAYIARMEYGISAGLRIALAECFPQDAPAANSAGLIMTLRHLLATFRKRGLRHARFELAGRLGGQMANLKVLKRPEPWWLGALTSLLGVGSQGRR